MNSATLSVTFAFADATTKTIAVGTFDATSNAVLNFKTRLKNFLSVDSETQKKVTNLDNYLLSDNGAAFSGIKSASITVSQSTRIFDAATYRP